MHGTVRVGKKEKDIATDRLKWCTGQLKMTQRASGTKEEGSVFALQMASHLHNSSNSDDLAPKYDMMAVPC